MKAFYLVAIAAIVGAKSIESTETWNATIPSNDTSKNATETTDDEYYDDYYYLDFGNDTHDDWDDSDWDNITEKPKEIIWMRPDEIANNSGYDKPLLFKDGHTRFDINQGYIGDCWFLAALALLPAYPKVFNNVLVDPNQSFENNPAGKAWMNSSLTLGIEVAWISHFRVIIISERSELESISGHEATLES